ncbi:MAG TPA: heat-inducible transcriptional repressor HrcA [Acidimicrobiales bacterium]
MRIADDEPGTMLDDRKAAILRAVVEQYIETAQPVGSGHVVRGGSLNVSPATVRNEMAALEAEGYLRQPHTSAGRVPTEKGYRFFVDHLAPPRLAAWKAEQVSAFFARAHGEMEQMLAETSRLLSTLTDYAAVVVSPPHEAASIRSVQLVGLSGQLALVVVVLSNGAVEKATVELDGSAGPERLAAATAHLSTHVVGTTLASVRTVPATGDVATDHLVAAALDAVAPNRRHADGDQVYVGGASRVVAAFEAVDTVRKVLSILEEQYLVVSLLRDVVDRGMNVAIGTETGLEPLAECSLVVAPFEAGGEGGTIAVLGPTRMDYPQALAAVAVVSHRLGHRLSEG